MKLPQWSLGSTLAALAILAAPVGCASGDGGSTHFSLKVVAQPRGGSVSTFCSQLGSSSGGTGGDNMTAGRWFQTSSHNTSSDGTWYDVQITGFNGNVHAWRYDEALARNGAVLDVRYDDVSGPVEVRISGAFAAIVPCAP